LKFLVAEHTQYLGGGVVLLQEQPDLDRPFDPLKRFASKLPGQIRSTSEVGKARFGVVSALRESQ